YQLAAGLWCRWAGYLTVSTLLVIVCPRPVLSVVATSCRDCCGGGSSRQNLSCSDHDDPGHDHFCGLVWLCDLCGQLQPRRGLFDDHHPSLGAGLWWTVGVGWCSSSAAQSLAWTSRLGRGWPDRYLWGLP